MVYMASLLLGGVVKPVGIPVEDRPDGWAERDIREGAQAEIEKWLDTVNWWDSRERLGLMPWYVHFVLKQEFGGPKART